MASAELFSSLDPKQTYMALILEFINQWINLFLDFKDEKNEKQRQLNMLKKLCL